LDTGETGSQQERKIDAAVPDDGPHEWDDVADEQHAGEGQEKTGCGEGPGVWESAVQGGQQGKDRNDPNEKEFQGEEEIYLLPAGAWYGLKESIE